MDQAWWRALRDSGAFHVRVVWAVVEIGLVLAPATVLMGILVNPNFGPEGLVLGLFFLPVLLLLWLAVPVLVVVLAFVVSPREYRVVSAWGVMIALLPAGFGLFESADHYAIAGWVYLEAVCWVVAARELKRWWSRRCDTEKQRFDIEKQGLNIEEALDRMGGPPQADARIDG